MKRTINLLLMSLGVATHSQLMADGCCPDERTYIPAANPLDPCCGATPGIPFPASLDIECGWDVYAMGEWLYWKMASAGNSNSPLCTNESLNGSQIFNILNNFNYTSGFRVAVGMDLKEIDVEAKYTRYHFNQSQSFTAPNNFLLKAFNVSGLTAPSFSSAEKNSDFKLDVLDLLAKKTVYLGTRTTFEAGMGLKTTWSTQNFNDTYVGLGGGTPTNPNGTVQNHRKFWAMGPTAFMNGKYMLPWGFRFIGGVELSIAYADVSNSYVALSFPGASTSTFNGLNTKTKTNGRDFWTLIDGQIGLAWESYFWCDKFHFSLFGTFETQRWTMGSNLGDSEFTRNSEIYGFNLGGQIEF